MLVVWFLFQVLLLYFNFTNLELISLSVMAMPSAGFSGMPGPHQDGGWENNFSVCP
jgi:hypothetical protein